VDLSLTFVGTSASVPTAARGTSATLLARGGERFLVDCGEGTQRQLLRSGLGLVDVDAVLVTHLHGDHYLGLPGLLKSYGLRGRERPLLLVGPRGLAALLGVLRPVVGRVPFRLEVLETAEGVVWADAGARIEAVPTRHSVPSVAYALIEDARPGTFDVAAARALGVPEGPLFGTLQRGGEVRLPGGAVVRPEQVLGTPRAGRRIVITGDTQPCDGVRAAAQAASVLVHEATFLDEDSARARETQHSTAGEAARLAREAGVALLALTHLSSRVAPSAARAEAGAEFPDVVVPRDFDQVVVPFPERGGPELRAARPETRPRVAAEAPDEALRGAGA
jgi:ribonuclease Z